MKRTAIVGAVVLVLLFGAVFTATTQTAETPKLDGVGELHLPKPYDPHPTQAWAAKAGLVNGDLLPCAAYNTGLGLDFIGVFAGGPVIAWLSGAHLTYTMTYDDANKACQAESFYRHIGHQKLCWNAHFQFWTQNGTAVFDDGLRACMNTPATLDAVLCQYLPHDGWEQACYNSLLDDYFLAVSASVWNGIGAWLF